MRSRLSLAALALSLAVGACQQDAPTSANTAPDGQQPAPEFQKASKLLKNIPVTGRTANGRVFRGKVTITRFDAQPIPLAEGQDPASQRGQLTVSGKLHLKGGGVTNFTGIPASLVQAVGTSAPTAAMDCSILDLDIGAIHLDLLGLVVDLAPVHLDVTGDTGPGNLLGNLLCALAGILDPGGAGLLSQIITLLTQINNILAGL